MHIYISNKPALLKEGTSFEYAVENRMFSGSDGYTLTITFPLRGCSQNLEIFGNINRDDVTAQRIILDCEIQCPGFHKYGSLTITEITEMEVKCQFLEGRSEQNFDQTFDKVYINELELGQGPSSDKSMFTPAQAWNPATTNYRCVALPWVNNAENGTTHNFGYYVGGKYEWSQDVRELTWQPYLVHVVSAIFAKIGYSADLSEWLNRPAMRNLLVCNTLPASWDAPDFARALPHWSVSEFIAKLELFLGIEFEVDHRAKTIEMKFTQDILQETPSLALTDIVAEHSTAVTAAEAKSDYLQTKNLYYKEASHSQWKYLSCDWFIRSRGTAATEFATIGEFLTYVRPYRKWMGLTPSDCPQINRLYYVRENEAYYMLRTITRKFANIGQNYYYTQVIQPINIFGGRIVEYSNADTEDKVEIEFTPCRIDATDDTNGETLFLDPGSFSEVNDEGSEGSSEPVVSAIEALLKAGNRNKRPEYFDSIYIGYWDGTYPEWGKQPHPWTDVVSFSSDWSTFRKCSFSLRLNSVSGKSLRQYPEIDSRRKCTFKFLASSIPDVRAIFNIHGKLYLCEKITATFSAETGMSQLLKGEFRPLNL